MGWRGFMTSSSQPAAVSRTGEAYRQTNHSASRKFGLGNRSEWGLASGLRGVMIWGFLWSLAHQRRVLPGDVMAELSARRVSLPLC